MSQRKAALKFDIPKTTLQNHLRNPEQRIGKGQVPVLSSDEESKVVDWIIESAKRGNPKSSLDVLDAANRLLHHRMQSLDRNLGRGWLDSFKKRHRLSHRVAESITKASANLTEENIRNWFHKISTHILECPDLLEAICDSKRVFNCDESMLRLSSTAEKVIAPKGMRNLFEVNKDDKSGLTVMATFRADGVAMKPFIIYPYERVPSSLIASFPSNNATLAATKSGWMNSETFCLYMEAVAKEMKEQNIKFPVLLFLDNHSSHATLEACETARKLGIEMVFLYPNSTFMLQPADVAVFRSLKSLWREENRQLKQKEIVITKSNFAEHFLKAFGKIGVQTVKAGFYKCGLFPLNSDNVDYSKCIGEKTKNASFSDQHDETAGELQIYSQNDFLEGFQHPIILSYEVLTEESRFWQSAPSEFGKKVAEVDPALEFVAEEPSNYEVAEIFAAENLVAEVDTIQEFVAEMDQENQENSFEPILELPPIPKRKGKRNIKRTHPFASQNINDLRESMIKKNRIEDEKQAKKAVRLQKKNEKILEKIEKEKKKMEKSQKMIENLLKKH